MNRRTTAALATLPAFFALAASARAQCDPDAPELAVAAPQAAAALQATPTVGLPLINQPAPEFEAKTTHGIRRLSDYRGRWLVLFSHPADFTPVCTTEFIGFAKAWPRFQELDTDLLGLSIDSLYSHIAWTRTIEEKFGVAIPFPIIDDLSMRVARAYGMIHPDASDTAAVRATFVIDPEGILRAMVYYPMTNGRSVDEFLRIVEALQTSDRERVATPEGWRPGEPVIVPPPSTTAAAAARMQEGYDCKDWFFCTTPAAGQTAAAAEEAHRLAFAEKLEPYECGDVKRLHTYRGVFLASQPSPDDFEQAKLGGIKTVIDQRHASERKDFDERAVVTGLGLEYRRLAWNGVDELTDAMLDRTREALRTAPRPLLIHCSSANRTGATWLAYRVLDDGLSVEAALAEAKTVGLRSPDYERVVRDYIARRQASN